MLPLEGVTVVSLEQAVAAPFATRQLADLGARVIKIERPDKGDFARSYDETVRGMASHFVWLNRSKESLALDLKHPEAAEIIRGLLADADVFVQNLAPGAAERLGLGGEALLSQHPRLIVCAITGYGSGGPYEVKKAYDLLIQCETGLVSITGTTDTPSRTGISIADIAGGMYAFTGVLTALYQRERSGAGTTFEVSLFDALGEWMGFPVYYTAYGGSAPARTGTRHAAIAPYGAFTVAGGDQINLAIQNEREWQTFCSDVLEQPGLAQDARFVTNSARVAHEGTLRNMIESAFSALTVDAVLTRLEQAGIANARINSVAEFIDHPQLRARGRWREVDSPVGPLRALHPPVTMRAVEPRMDPIPGLGQHTRAILGALGYDGHAIEELRRCRAVSFPDPVAQASDQSSSL